MVIYADLYLSKYCCLMLLLLDMQKQFQQTNNAVSKQKSQTLDSLFANMKEQRMRVFSQHNNNNVPRRSGGGQPRVPWARNLLRN